MDRLVIVPARGGSKRLPNKNKRKLAGKPLVFHTLDAVSGLFEIVIFTSDSEDLLDMVRSEYKDQVIVEKRPDKLVGDTSKVIDTVCYYIHKFRTMKFNQVWLALPTCPLRNGHHVKQAQLELTKEYDSLISITDFEFPPTLGLLMDEYGTLTEYGESNFANGNSRSQDQPAVYRPNGALYGAWRSSFERNMNFYLGKVKAYYMPRICSVDIDNELDLKWAEYIKNQKTGFDKYFQED